MNRYTDVQEKIAVTQSHNTNLYTSNKHSILAYAFAEKSDKQRSLISKNVKFV